MTHLWVRLGKAQYLDVPMSHQDIADYLGVTIETLSRSITDLERSGLISRVSSLRRLLLQNHFWPSACNELSGNGPESLPSSWDPVATLADAGIGLGRL